MEDQTGLKAGATPSLSFHQCEHSPPASPLGNHPREIHFLHRTNAFRHIISGPLFFTTKSFVVSTSNLVKD